MVRKRKAHADEDAVDLLALEGDELIGVEIDEAAISHMHTIAQLKKWLEKHHGEKPASHARKKAIVEEVAQLLRQFQTEAEKKKKPKTKPSKRPSVKRQKEVDEEKAEPSPKKSRTSSAFVGSVRFEHDVCIHHHSTISYMFMFFLGLVVSAELGIDSCEVCISKEIVSSKT